MANKITKKDVINMMLADEAIKTNEVYVGYLSHELELLDKKASSKKPTKAQEANNNFKEIILAVLKASDKAMTITAMQDANGVLGQLSNQKVSALVRQLCNENVVVKTVDKKSSLFSLAV